MVKAERQLKLFHLQLVIFQKGQFSQHLTLELSSRTLSAWYIMIDTDQNLFFNSKQPISGTIGFMCRGHISILKIQS